MNPIKLLIVDDHPIIREGLVVMIGPCPDINIIGTCKDGLEAIEAVQGAVPDVILMDIKMANVNGFEATREIVSSYPGVKVIILTACEDAESVRLALQAGASGYILKQVSRERLVESIRLTYRGETAIDQVILNQLVTGYTRLAQDCAAHNHSSANCESKDLTPREREVAKFLTLGLSNREISIRSHLSQDTVKSHLRNIYRKLGVKNRIQAITELMNFRYIKV